MSPSSTWPHRGGSPKELVPGVDARRQAIGKESWTDGRGNVPANGVTFVSVDTPLTLLQVDRVGREGSSERQHGTTGGSRDLS